MRSASLIFALGSLSQSALASLDIDPYVYDSTFNGGVVIEDRFAAISPDYRQIAHQVTRLSDGSLVVAGLVPAAFQPNQSDGRFNVGLVRYGPHGEREPWTSPTPAYSYFNNMYVDYPNSNSAPFGFVHDLVAVDDRLYALVDRTLDSGQHDVSILTLTVGGELIADSPAFDTELQEYGAGFVHYSDGVENKLIAIATYINGADQRVITLKRFDLSPGAPVVDVAFGVSGNGAMDQPFPDSACGAPPCSAVAQGVGAVRTSSASPTLYITGSAWDQGSDWNPFLMAIDGRTGELAAKTYVQYGGMPGTNSVDQGNALLAMTSGGPETDIVYVVGSVEMTCGRGVTVSKVRGWVDLPGGPFVLPEFTWASEGTTTFGGSLDLPPCTNGSRYSQPFAVAQAGDRIAIGVRDTITGVITPLRGPVLALVRPSDGVWTAFDDHVALRSDGTPWGPSTFDDIIANADGSVTATGFITDENSNGGQLFGTTRLRSDRIFGDGFG